MWKIERISLNDDTGNVWMTGARGHQCWCYPAATIAYNASPHFHSPPLDIRGVPIPRDLQLFIISQLYITDYNLYGGTG